MSLNDALDNRLYNWKFERAVDYLDADVTETERELICALADTFGNPGWMGGAMEVIIGAALSTIGVTFD